MATTLSYVAWSAAKYHIALLANVFYSLLKLKRDSSEREIYKNQRKDKRKLTLQKKEAYRVLLEEDLKKIYDIMLSIYD